MESWYNKAVPPRWRIARQVQYDEYLIHEVVPLVRVKNRDAHLVRWDAALADFTLSTWRSSIGCFYGFLSMSGAFDLRNFLNGYYDQDCYFNQPWTICEPGR